MVLINKQSLVDDEIFSLARSSHAFYMQEVVAAENT